MLIGRKVLKASNVQVMQVIGWMMAVWDEHLAMCNAIMQIRIFLFALPCVDVHDANCCLGHVRQRPTGSAVGVMADVTIVSSLHV